VNLVTTDHAPPSENANQQGGGADFQMLEGHLVAKVLNVSRRLAVAIGIQS
jgi:hypothetical protein